ncbi:MAG: putative peptidoglycan glycosyltransferase FtsW [Patescibacteria group bacterium]
MIKKEYDKFLLIIVGIFIISGVFILTSASTGLLSRNGNVSLSNILFRQFVLGLGEGIILFLITSRIHYKKWKKFALIIFLISFLLTVLVFESHIGFGHGGARRWLNIGQFFFQPSELLKLAFIIYLASWLSTRQEHVQSFKFGLVPFLIIVGLVGLVLIKQPDIGTLGVVAITSLTMFFIGGGRLSQIAFTIFLGVILVYILTLTYPHVANRLVVFLNPSADPQGIGYQMKQSLIAIGSGGLLGRGFGMSVQKFYYLPEPIGDSIFAVFAEEFGFMGSLFLIGLFMFFLYRGFSIVLKVPDQFARLLGSGIVILIVAQSLINIGSMTGIIPLTGLPLVFISQGGSSLAMAMAEVGILFNISRYV